MALALLDERPRFEPGPIETALDELWTEARGRLLQPRRLWTWFWLARRFDLRMVQPRRVKVMIPAGRLPDCDSCLELCCTGPNAVVSLRLKDIARLIDGGRTSYIVPATPGRTSRSTASGARRRLEASVFASMFPVLDRDETGTCALLDADRRCSAYPAWPLSCARYPYAFDVDNRVVFWAKGCGSERLVSLDDAPTAVRDLVDASVEAYNARVRDIVLLHVAMPELVELGLVEHLRLEGRLAKAAGEAREAASSAREGGSP